MSKQYIVINLNKAESAETRLERIREQVRWGTFAFLMILLLGVNTRVWMISNGYNNIIDQKKIEIERLKDEIDKFQSEGKNLSKEDILLFADLEQDRFLWAQNLEAMGKMTPDDMAITGLRFKRNKLKIKGIALTFEDQKDFKIIDERVGSIPELPKELSVSTFPEEKDAALRRQIDLNMQMMKGHTINGKQFEMNRVDLQVKQGQIEIWEFINDTPTPHPMHIHAIQFKVLDRSGSRGILPHETGWKDTVLVMPGEHVRVIMKFDAPKGMYVFHCHNLEHEDSGMMANYEIT